MLFLHVCAQALRQAALERAQHRNVRVDPDDAAGTAGAHHRDRAVRGVAYMYAKEKGIETSFRMALREIRPCAGKALGMGIVDLACIVAAVSCIARLLDKNQLALGLGSAVLLYLLLFYLSTAMFRYPVLTLNPHLSLGQVVLCAMSMTLKNMGWMFLYWCVVLLALLICGATGVGMVLLLPGCTALMMTTAWSESLKKEEYRRQQNAA